MMFKKIFFSIYIAVVVYFFATQLLFAQQSITIDFNQKAVKKESIAGFLHFNDLESLDKNVKELKPRYWRVGNALHNKSKRIEQIQLLHSHNIIPILVITDFFAGIEDDWERPYKYKTKFSNLVKDLYLENGNSVVYDIWNEPDANSKWSREQFFETFKVAYQTIRSLPGGKDAIITGPGTSRFDREFLEQFLEYCNTNKLEVNILNWHEGGILKDVLDVQNNILTAKMWMKKYPNVRIEKIFIPEILWITEQFNPAAVIAYLSVIEKNGASGACKTCWDTSVEEGGNTCWNNSIDGLLDPKGNTRSVWWAYKLYAETLDKRLTSQTSTDSLMNFAYFDDKNNFSLLFVNSSQIDNATLQINLNNIKKSNIDFKNFKSLVLYEIPNTDSKELKEPIVKLKKRISLKNNDDKISLSDIKYNKLYYLVFSKK